MAAYFFDSSAIIKRYVNERGSAWVSNTATPTGGAHIYVAAITGVEVVAAFARKLKGNLVSPVDAAATILTLSLRSRQRVPRRWYKRRCNYKVYGDSREARPTGVGCGAAGGCARN